MEWSYDGAHCYLTIHGFVDMPDWGPDAQAWYTRWVYFDGENLRFY